MCHDLWRFFFRHMCVGYWVPRLHELIARIAIQQFRGERSSSYRGWFLWHQPKHHAFFDWEIPSKLDPTPQKFLCNFMTPVLIIGCLWFSYCSCLSHEVPPEHTLKKKRTIFVIGSRGWRILKMMEQNTTRLTSGISWGYKYGISSYDPLMLVGDSRATLNRVQVKYHLLQSSSISTVLHEMTGWNNTSSMEID